MEKVVSNLIVNEEFESLLLPLKSEERDILEQSILSEGCINPIVVWRRGEEQIIIDGHNRYNICKKHGLDFEVSFLSFKSIQDVKYWIVNNQLGRRNLSLEQLSYYRGLKYLQLKNSKGGYQKVLSKGQNEPLTSELIAKEFKVSPSTIKRDFNYAKGIEIIAKSNPQLKLRILNGDSEIPKKDIQFLGEREKSIKVKNEADLYNKISQIKKETLDDVENELKSLHDPLLQEDKKAIMEDPFSSYEDQMKRIKGTILSYINLAIEKKDLNAINKLRELIDRLAHLIQE